MSKNISSQGLNRREFISSALAYSGAAVAAGMLGDSKTWAAAPLPNPSTRSTRNIRFGITGALWGDWPNGNLRMSTDMQQIIADTARFGLQGIEPYSGQVVQFLGNPLALKRMCDAAGIQLIDVGDLPRAPGSKPASSQAPRLIPHLILWISRRVMPSSSPTW